MSSTVERIEDDVNQSRHRLNDTLSELKNKLTPGQMVDEALGLAQGQLGTFAAKLGQQILANPLPVIMVAVGSAWLMSSGESAQRDRGRYDARRQRYDDLEEAHRSVVREDDESEEDYNDRLHSAYASALQLTQSAGEKAHEFRDRVAQTASDLKGSAKDFGAQITDTVKQGISGLKHGIEGVGQKARNAKFTAQDVFDENPLVAGALMFAVGSIIGTAAPLSNTESRSLSGVANEALKAGKALVERGVQSGKEAMEGLRSQQGQETQQFQ